MFLMMIIIDSPIYQCLSPLGYTGLAYISNVSKSKTISNMCKNEKYYNLNDLLFDIKKGWLFNLGTKRPVKYFTDSLKTIKIF